MSGTGRTYWASSPAKTRGGREAADAEAPAPAARPAPEAELAAMFHPDTLKEIRKHVQTDHINSRLCDDPVNFFLLLDTVNSKFGYERLMNYKKKFMGDAWAGVVYFVSRAIELQQRLCRG